SRSFRCFICATQAFPTFSLFQRALVFVHFLIGTLEDRNYAWIIFIFRHAAGYDDSTGTIRLRIMLIYFFEQFINARIIYAQSP
ncbi:MAG: hypothetical protein IIY88_06885, partial [Eubacterium sp.]|nr:hypothetical protein [Eubacterium sp.]